MGDLDRQKGSSSPIKVESGVISVNSGELTPIELKALKTVLAGVFPQKNFDEGGAMIFPRVVLVNGVICDLWPLISQTINGNPQLESRRYEESLNLDECLGKAREFADLIRDKQDDIVRVLTTYETHAVAQDEIGRSLDLLDNLGENSDYFKKRVGPSVAFLPKNQPLYAFCCFVLVPALMSRECHFRIPASMQGFFPKLLSILELADRMPAVVVHDCKRDEFVKKVSPIAEVVIFTGNMENADRMRGEFGKNVLFIANGSGHNPVIVTETANVKHAVEAAINVQFYNQGQDCAAPNSVLVHDHVYEEFVDELMKRISELKVGKYEDKEVSIGPVTDVSELVRIQAKFVLDQRWLSERTPGVIQTKSATVEPTVIEKPLAEGGNYDEQFSPIMHLQRYEKDSELARYFNSERYARNAMYLTVFGRSPYLDARSKAGWKSHPPSSILTDTNLHAPGMERGVKEYGGYGRGASSVSMQGVVISKPTLPQREIFDYLVAPGLEGGQKVYIPASIETVLNGKIEKVPSNRMANEDLQNAPDWASFTADRVIETFPDEEVYTCAAGISPSGVVHFGNFRDIMIALAVAKALKAKGKKVKLLFSWDDFDRFRKVPKGIPSTYSQYLGMPLVNVPDPTGEFPSYAERFEREFEDTMAHLGIEVEMRRQSNEYQAGTYREGILKALQERRQIGEILFEHMSSVGVKDKELDRDDFVESFYPVIIYSKFSGKDHTRVVDYDGEYTITYFCEDTKQEATLDLRTDTNIKLNWKVDWPMRWRHERVTFEPGGKDHASIGGSYDVSSIVSQQVYGRVPPVFVGYDFVGISGIEGKMSSSAGNALSPRDLLEVYTEDLLIYVYESIKPGDTFNLCFDKNIYRQYDKYDKEHPDEKAIPLRHAVAYGQITNWDVDKAMVLLQGIGMEFSRESLVARFPRARAWLERYNQDEMIKLLEEPNTQYYESLGQNDLSHLDRLVSFLKENKGAGIAEFEDMLYFIPKREGQSEEEMKAAQKKFFENIYFLLFNNKRGPRLSTYFWAVGVDTVLKLLKPGESENID